MRSKQKIAISEVLTSWYIRQVLPHPVCIALSLNLPGLLQVLQGLHKNIVIHVKLLAIVTNFEDKCNKGLHFVQIYEWPLKILLIFLLNILR
jgi:hypothetical protein